MSRGYQPGLAERTCRLLSCTTVFTPTQVSQRYCSPSHRYDAARLRRAIPVARDYLARVLADLDDETVVVS